MAEMRVAPALDGAPAAVESSQTDPSICTWVAPFLSLSNAAKMRSTSCGGGALDI